MAEVGLAGASLVLSAAQTLFSALQTKEVKELCSKFNCESSNEKLQDTMSTIKAVLLDVESKRQGLTHEGQVWVEKLKDAVYDFDDLLDEFNTIAQRNKQDAKLSKKVGRFFSRNNKFLVSFNVSREINLLREKLEAIAKNHVDFGFTDVTTPVKLREETCSVISELELIGREDDKEDIVRMLLSDQDHSLVQNVSYVTIVGIGGLGKTTLAQLVYNDKRVEGAFSKRIWVCVSEEFGVKEILGKILGGKKDQPLEELQRQARTLLERKKYLLVLDDVWNESHVEWRKLKPFFVSDVSGSKIIVTTRSKKVASSIGEDSTIYELNGLSEENSWSLFKRIAFGKGDQVNTELVEIAEDIAKKCCNVPLSIRVTASLLHDLDKSKWQLFRDSELAKLWRGNEEDSVMSTLMFSYYNLSPELKGCFSYCSLFPKDHNFKKKELISLWLAQGFLVATYNHESIEDIGERYFTILLNRCFFQDIKLDDYGEVGSCKMHDLMHDLAVEVAGKESSIITSVNENRLSNKLRHISIYDSRLESNLCIGNTLRTFIGLSIHNVSLEDLIAAILSKGRRLRVLYFSESLLHGILPDLFGKLLHLRYLDLSFNGSLVMLPKSITKLHNLQILNLKNCTSLEELPEDTSKLVNLRTLDTYGCMSLSHMPKGMDNLKNLHTLTEFVVGGGDSKQVQGSKLVDLQAFTSLKGNLRIRIRHFKSCNMPRATETALKLKDAHELKIIYSYFAHGNHDDQSEVHETLVEQVCPNDDIVRIKIVGYQGMKMPSWASMLVSVKVSSVKGLQQVTSSLSQLCHLKVLELKCLPNVEYIESEAAWELVSRPNNSNESKIVVFFPVLEKLGLIKMPKLKGWWREVRWEEMDGCLADDGNGGIQEHASVTLPYFPHLRELQIWGCESMMYFPPCPYLKELYLREVNEALTFCNKKGSIVASGVTSISRPFSSDSTSSSSDVLWFLENLLVRDERAMNSVSKEFVGGVVHMNLTCEGNNKEGMQLVKEGFERCGSSLQHLVILNCGKLREIGIEQLTNLQSLHIVFYDEVDEEDNESEEEEGMPWKNLQSLSSLKLECCKEMVELPKGLRYLGTSLQSLEIYHCNKMEELGETIRFLTSLQSLRIEFCDKLKALPESLKFLTSLHTLYITVSDINELKKRCQPDGEDWPKICHIPNIKTEEK